MGRPPGKDDPEPGEDNSCSKGVTPGTGRSRFGPDGQGVTNRTGPTLECSREEVVSENHPGPSVPDGEGEAPWYVLFEVGETVRCRGGGFRTNREATKAKGRSSRWKTGTSRWRQ